MFGFSKKHQDEFIPPTDRQIRYAKKIGIDNAEGMSRDELSAEISNREHADPSLRAKRELIAEKQRVRNLGHELIEAEKKWERFTEGNSWVYADYTRKGNKNTGIIEIYDVEVSDSGKIILYVSAHKECKDAHLGEHVSWEREFQLSVTSFLYYHSIDELHGLLFAGEYHSLIKAQEKVAARNRQQGITVNRSSNGIVIPPAVQRSKPSADIPNTPLMKRAISWLFVRAAIVLATVVIGAILYTGLGKSDKLVEKSIPQPISVEQRRAEQRVTGLISDAQDTLNEGQIEEAVEYLDKAIATRIATNRGDAHKLLELIERSQHVEHLRGRRNPPARRTVPRNGERWCIPRVFGLWFRRPQ